MKKRTLLKYYIGIVCTLIIGMTSCNELDLAPTNKFSDLNYWDSPEKASAMLSKAYEQMIDAEQYFGNEFLSDNLYEGRGSGREKDITAGIADAANGRFSDEWKKCFEGIRSCHTFLENVDEVPSMDEALRTRMKAEARYIRASLFFRLTCHFGDTPLFDHGLTQEEANTIARSPKAEVVAFIRSELNEIVSQLPTKQEYADADKGRVTQGTVMTLLARTYLYENNWSNVASICQDIINGKYGYYALFPNYAGLFLPENEYNDEVIMDIGYTLNLRTWDKLYDAIPLSAGARINAWAPTQELVDDYIMLNGKAINEAGSDYNEDDPYVRRDPRLGYTVVYHGYNWVKGDGSSSTIYIKPGSAAEAGDEGLDEYAGQGQNTTSTGYYLRKQFDPEAPEGVKAGLNLITMRYADILLMYAEAKYELGEMNQAVWDLTIREIRKRAGFEDAYALDYPGNNADLRTIIRRERRCELAIEGLRLFDIRRWGTIETVMNGIPHGAKFDANNTQYIELERRQFNKDRDYLFAIPQSELDINKSLKQNPGY